MKSKYTSGVSRKSTRWVRIASANGIRCVDLEKEFSTGYDNTDPIRSRPIVDPTLYMPDGLHPNDAGTQVMALSFADLF